MNKTAKKINAQIELNDNYKKLNISDFKLPDFKPMPDIGNITNAYLSAFNTGMTIYECLSWLQGYVQANRDALVQLIGDLNKFQESIENALNSIVENLRELDAKLGKETEDRKAADIVLDGKITTEKEERTAEDTRLDGKIDQTKEDLNAKIEEIKNQLENFTPTGGSGSNLSFSDTLNAYTNREAGIQTPCENVVVEPSINTQDVIFDIVEDISEYDYILVGVRSRTWANSNHYEQILVPCKKSKLYGEYNGISITQEGENNTFKYTCTLDFKCFQDTDGFYKVECKAFGAWDNGLNVTMRGAKSVPSGEQSGGVTTQKLTPKTTSFSDNASTSAVPVQVETNEDLSQFKMLYVCLVSQNVPTALGVSAITFLMPINDFGWGEIKTLIDPAMHLYYVGCQGVSDGKINFNVANLSGTAASYTINSIVGIK